MPHNLDPSTLLLALQKGEMNLQGQFLQGSNYTFLAHVEYPGGQLAVVYKPTRGEQPLWDFPGGTLAKREVVAFQVSEALGWKLVPPTVYRRQAPLGPGSVQLFIEHDAAYHYFNFEEGDKQRLRPVILFDFLINNADRKASHVFVDSDDHLWLIDHGLSFHTEDKLRTVIWDFAGEAIPENLIADMRRFLLEIKAELPLQQELLHFLKPEEVGALSDRALRLIERGCFPTPPTDRRVYPWPPV
jgi:uncharacterized repeat protein (TIGR03843 family)